MSCPGLRIFLLSVPVCVLHGITMCHRATESDRLNEYTEQLVIIVLLHNYIAKLHQEVWLSQRNRATHHAT